MTEFNGTGVEYYTYYTYDVQGNLIGVVDHHSNTTSMTYNLLGWKTQMTDPDMGTWQYEYDKVGNLTAQRDGRSLWLHMEYDDLNRLVRKRRDTVNTGPKVAEYVYDATGKKGLLDKSLSYDDAGSLVLVEVQYPTYDARNRLTQQTWVVNGSGSFLMDYTYNEADQRTSLRYPADGNNQRELVNYSYNSVGQLTGVVGTNTYVSSASYNAQGQLTQMNQPSLTRTRSYESNTLRLSSVTAGTTSPWTNRQQLTYSYDNNSNVTSLTDHQNQTSGTSQVQSFGYDWLDRLVTASTNAAGVGQYNHTYTYNAIGNLTSNAGVSQGYNDANHDHAVTHLNNVQKYWYDANGNQVTRIVGGVTYTLTYDRENRLTEVKQGAITIAKFWYDADGNRVKGEVGTNPSITTIYIAGLYEYSNSIHKKYYEGPGGIVAVRDGSSLSYLLQDHLNSTARIVTSSGTIQDTTYYFPFGGKRAGNYNSITAKRFTGQYHEKSLASGSSEDGLYYYGARWYDATLGRFTQADTLVPDPGNPQDLNRYAYVRNNPLKYTDPSGHTPACMSMGHPLATIACQLVDAAAKYGPRLVTTIGSIFAATAFNGSEHNAPHVTRPVAVPPHQPDPLPSFQSNTILELPLEAPVTDIWITRPFDRSTTVQSNVVGGGFSLPSQSSVQDSIYTSSGLQDRAGQIHSALDWIAQHRRTTAVARTIDSSGNTVILVASSANTLTPAQRAMLRPGEIAVVGAGHAEVTAIDYAVSRGWRVLEVAASRPICEACADRIREVGAVPVSPLKE